MAESFEAVLATYNARAADELEQQKRHSWQSGALDRDKFLLHVGEEVGHFLRSLIIARGAKRIVELGTSYGYSTLFLADAARAVGGRVSTLELSGEKQRHAREQLARAQLDGHVDWLQGDALEVLAGLEGPFDFVLIDLWKEAYVPSFELLYPKLSAGAIVAADNIIYPDMVREDAERYRAAVRAKPGMGSVLLPIGQGIELSCYLPERYPA